MTATAKPSRPAATKASPRARAAGRDASRRSATSTEDASEDTVGVILILEDAPTSEQGHDIGGGAPPEPPNQPHGRRRPDGEPWGKLMLLGLALLTFALLGLVLSELGRPKRQAEG